MLPKVNVKVNTLPHAITHRQGVCELRKGVRKKVIV